MKQILSLKLVIVAFLCLVGWTVHAQMQNNTRRQAWEYKTMVLVIRGAVLTLFEDGKQVPGQVTPVTRAPELGAEGWELVSVTGTVESSEVNRTTTTTYVYWFKRQK